MAQPTISLFVDVQNRQLVRSFTSTVPAIMPTVYQGDTVALVLRFLQATGVSSAPYTDIDYSAAAVTVGVGEIGAQPTAGTFTITDTGASQTTSALPYNATATEVQVAIQSALLTNWHTATVLGNQGGPFTITNGKNGVQTALVGTSLDLAPSSSVPIDVLQDGESSLPAMQLAKLSFNPIALQTSWVASHSPELLTADLSFATSAIEELMGNSPCIRPTLSIRVVPSGGEAFTVYQRNFVIQNDLIDGAPSIPAPGISYYTTTESDARYGQGQSVAVTRNSTGSSTQHIAVGASSNVLYLVFDAVGAIAFTVDNGQFDGQTFTLRVSTDLNPPSIPVSFSDNVGGSTDGALFGDGVCISYLWDAPSSYWLPM